MDELSTTLNLSSDSDEAKAESVPIAISPSLPAKPIVWLVMSGRVGETLSDYAAPFVSERERERDNGAVHHHSPLVAIATGCGISC